MDLKCGNEVICQWASVCCDWYIAVKLRQSRARHFSSVLTNVVFAKKELTPQHTILS